MMRFQENLPKSNEIASQLATFFDKSILEQMAKETKFVQRVSPITGSIFANLCIRSISKKGMALSLNQQCVIASELGAPILEQSLNERFNKKAVCFMKSLFEKSVGLCFEETALDIMSFFSQVILEDSTVIQLPEELKDTYKGSGGGASKSAIKIDLTYDLKAARFKMDIRQGSQPDSSMSLPALIVARSLWLRDLGYFRIADMERIGEEKAYYVSRLKYKVNVYLTTDKTAKPVDLLTLMRGMRVNQVKDMKVYIGAKKRSATRLVLQRVPKKVADKKRHKLKKEKNKKRKNVSENRLEFCGCNAYITNLEAPEWAPHLIMKLYKIRWQIEILFKAWKSTLEFGTPGKMSLERFQCLLYGQLIWAIINGNIFQAFKVHFWNTDKIEISELKVYKIMKTLHYQLVNAIRLNCKILYEHWLNDICQLIRRLGKKQYKKGNHNPAFTTLFPLT